MIEDLLSDDPLARMKGLDAVSSVVLRAGALGSTAGEAMPYLLALATSRGYPHASALLARSVAILERAQASGSPEGGAVREAFRARASALLRTAATSSDPEAARVAACLCSRLSGTGPQVEPVLIALLSGATDPAERGRLLHALARVQASRGVEFHGRVAEALHRSSVDAEKVAVALALAEHDPPEPLRARIVEALRAALDREELRASDPRSWGRALERGALEQALERLGASG